MMRWRRTALLLPAGVAAAIGGSAYARVTDGTERVPTAAPLRANVVVPDDTTALARLLNAVRGADPLLCELATRNVDMNGWWSRGGGGRVGGSPIEVDSAAAATIAWIQADHDDPRLVPRLRAAMRDRDVCVRRVGASFLARVKHPSAAQALLEALGDPSADTRFVAAIGIGLSENTAALESLLPRLRDESAAVRRATAWALGSLQQRAAIAPLIESLERDADPRVRQAAAWALGRIAG